MEPGSEDGFVKPSPVANKVTVDPGAAGWSASFRVPSAFLMFPSSVTSGNPLDSSAGSESMTVGMIISFENSPFDCTRTAVWLVIPLGATQVMRFGLTVIIGAGVPSK